MFYGLDLAKEEKKIIILIFLGWFLYDTWFSGYIKYLVGYAFKTKLSGKIIEFKKVPEDCKNILGPNYYSVVEFEGEKYLKKRSFSDKIGQEIVFVKSNAQKIDGLENNGVHCGEVYDTKYKIPYANLWQIILSVLTLVFLWDFLF